MASLLMTSDEPILVRGFLIPLNMITYMFHTNIIWLAKGFFTHDITFGFPDLSRTPTVDVWC